MPRISQWEHAIGRRLRLRDLFVFFTVVECGSMSKAALRLSVSTPSVSELIADLEHAVGVTLLDRSSKGVTPTRFGKALLIRGQAAFDELRQGLRDIDSMADPGSGEVRIGCPESCAAFLALVIERVSRSHPRIRFATRQVHAPTVEFPELLSRNIDLVLARLLVGPGTARVGDEFDTEVLFEDPFSAVVGRQSKWARRRKLDLAEIAQERWILPPLDILAGLILKEAFESRGLRVPEPAVSTFSVFLRNHLASRGDYISVLPRSVLRLSAARYGLKVLPVELSSFRPSPFAVVTLKNRTLPPVVQVFLESAREAAKLFRSA
jgi:DNA-binding transcriptional LysR family regulator